MYLWPRAASFSEEFVADSQASLPNWLNLPRFVDSEFQQEQGHSNYWLTFLKENSVKNVISSSNRTNPN